MNRIALKQLQCTDQIDVNEVNGMGIDGSECLRIPLLSGMG